jgi:hypothetical protein
MNEKTSLNSKIRSLNWLYSNVLELDILPKGSFRKFRTENMYFLDGMSIKLQRQEYDHHYFYVVCKKVKLPITRKEINEFLFNRENVISS